MLVEPLPGVIDLQVLRVIKLSSQRYGDRISRIRSAVDRKYKSMEKRTTDYD